MTQRTNHALPLPYAMSSAWLHGAVNRDETEAAILEGGNEDGKFLVRLRAADRQYEFVLCVIYKGRPTHHLIVADEEGILTVNKKRFGEHRTIEELIAHLGLPNVPSWPVALSTPVPPRAPLTLEELALARPPAASSGAASPVPVPVPASAPLPVPAPAPAPAAVPTPAPAPPAPMVHVAPPPEPVPTPTISIPRPPASPQAPRAVVPETPPSPVADDGEEYELEQPSLGSLSSFQTSTFQRNSSANSDANQTSLDRHLAQQQSNPPAFAIVKRKAASGPAQNQGSIVDDVENTRQAAAAARAEVERLKAQRTSMTATVQGSHTASSVDHAPQPYQQQAQPSRQYAAPVHQPEPTSAPSGGASKSDELNKSLARAVIKLGNRVSTLEAQMIEMQTQMAELRSLADSLRSSTGGSRF
eukprot:m.294161 g.294161  ORF g.294161 m.294161 type:complete len:416 (-) comp12936_c0_seq1:83-1330(-)